MVGKEEDIVVCGGWETQVRMKRQMRNMPRSRLIHPLSTLLFAGACLAPSGQVVPPTGNPGGGSPEAVRLSEIVILTPQPYDSAQIAEAKRKAEDLHDAIRRGSSFDDVAKANSQGPRASTGGQLGVYRHGELAPSLEELVFHMKVGDISDVIRTKQGFIILEVTGRVGPDGRVVLPLELLNTPTTPELQAYMNEAGKKIRQGWYKLIPQSALAPEMKEGTLIVGFQIQSDGSVAELTLLSGTGDQALDDAALKAIRQAAPFSSLTNVTKKDHLVVRARFVYNPDKPRATPDWQREGRAGGCQPRVQR